jgi:thymidylate kinase
MTGTHGTGKTTLARMLQTFFPDFASAVDDARHMPNSADMSPEDKTKAAFDRRVAMFEKHEDIISDRFFSDTYAYAMYLGLKDLAEAALQEARRWMPNTVLAYVPVEFPFDRRDARHLDRVQIDRNVRQCLDIFRVDAVALFYSKPNFIQVSGCELNRLRAILQEIENRGRRILIHGAPYTVNARCVPIPSDNLTWICSPVNCGSENVDRGSATRGSVINRSLCGSDNCGSVNNNNLTERGSDNCGSVFPECGSVTCGCCTANSESGMALKRFNKDGDTFEEAKSGKPCEAKETNCCAGRSQHKKLSNEERKEAT